MSFRSCSALSPTTGSLASRPPWKNLRTVYHNQSTVRDSPGSMRRAPEGRENLDAKGRSKPLALVPFGAQVDPAKGDALALVAMDQVIEHLKQGRGGWASTGWVRHCTCGSSRRRSTWLTLLSLRQVGHQEA